MRTRMPLIAAAVAVLTLGIAAPASAAAPPTDPPAGWYTSPAHIWVDPTVGLEFDVEFFFTIPTSFWVLHAQAPVLFDRNVGHSVTHCQVAKTATGATFTCDTLGDAPAAPGDYSATIAVRSEGGDNYSLTAPITVCPLTGCSPEFDVELVSGDATEEPAAWETCAGADLTELGSVAYAFNVPWNADAVELSGVVGSAGDAPDAEVVPIGGAAAGDGFSLEGTIATPGEYTVTATITDEFGGEHTAELPLTVADCASPQLAATGSTTDRLDGMLALAVGFAGAGILAVAIAAWVTRRRVSLGG
ncbi:hypothetical protein [Antiquaquibacter soli]|uniref:Ig-like domain-containing protein n=1 Tax=Antiquaquibacter soli TaxID=3064523 RepID=A0ABT9BNK3_9MICO|nr:hypothetical protein [Protaetiibacter sp. WY-16]MDO7882617.1 hypothetical protein [Protaetiibacter sp. WY-16]